MIGEDAALAFAVVPGASVMLARIMSASASSNVCFRFMCSFSVDLRVNDGAEEESHRAQVHDTTAVAAALMVGV